MTKSQVSHTVLTREEWLESEERKFAREAWRTEREERKAAGVAHLTDGELVYGPDLGDDDLNAMHRSWLDNHR